MATTTKRLTAMQVEKFTEPGLYPDGLCLYLQVTGNSGKSWLFRPKIRGKRRDIGLGSVARGVSLSKARELAAEMREKLASGWDPIEARNDAKAARNPQLPTFSECALDYIEVKRPEWKNQKHPEQWKNTLQEYCFPFFGKVPVRDVNKGHVLQALQAPAKDRAGNALPGSFWSQKPETASRVRSRIEIVLDYAKAKDFRDGDNPARWRANLAPLLPAPAKVRRPQHQPAMPWKQCPAFMRDLLSLEPCSSGLALAFCVLTATRTGELITARWRDLDLDDGVWHIPAERRKGPKGEENPLRVPLSFEALTVLAAAHDIRRGEYIFPGGKARSPLSNMALLEMLRGLGITDAVVHGFRSSFRDWAADHTDFANEVCEAALGHVIPGKVEGAYRRGDLLEKRWPLMQAWADFLLPVKNATNVVDLKVA